MDLNNKQFKLARLFAFMNNLKMEHGDDIDDIDWVQSLIDEQEELEVFVDDEILRQFIEVFTENAGEITYEGQLYFTIDDFIVYVNDGLITISYDYEERLKIISAEEMGDFDDFEIEYVN